jgi:hypothetical protein
MVVGGNAFYIMYFFFPLIIVASAPLLIKGWPFITFKRIYVSVILVDIVCEIVFASLMNTDSNKVPYTIHNMSPYTINHVNVVARNGQYMFLGDIGTDRLKKIYCNCRDVDIESSDTIGLVLSYRINNKNIRLNLLGSNENLSDDSIEIRIINDTLVYKSYYYQNESLWSRIGPLEYKGQMRWDAIEKTLPARK